VFFFTIVDHQVYCRVCLQKYNPDVRVDATINDKCLWACETCIQQQLCPAPLSHYFERTGKCCDNHVHFYELKCYKYK